MQLEFQLWSKPDGFGVLVECHRHILRHRLLCRRSVAFFRSWNARRLPSDALGALAGGPSRASWADHPARSRVRSGATRRRAAESSTIGSLPRSGMQMVRRALRAPRERARNRGKAFIADALMISDRPAEIDDRAVPGHWEGDLILGLGSWAIGILVERTTRFTMLLHLPRMEGHGTDKTLKNWPALAGHGAEAVRNAIAGTISSLPAHLRRSLTWDQGAEMAQHAQLRIDTGLEIYFCDPQSPWQRGSNENTNGLLRQYFPKSTDFQPARCRRAQRRCSSAEHAPRKTLAWQTPAEALDRLLKQDIIDGVATTG